MSAPVVLAGAAPFSSAPLWYLTRSTGILAFVLLTAAVALGVASTRRAVASGWWPKFATQSLHRNVSLLGLGFLVAHIVTTTVDSFVDVGWISDVVPFTSSYKRVRVGLGAIAFDVIVLVIVTSLLRLRLRMPQRLWRGIHLSVYGAWVVSLLHFVSAGTDVQAGRFGVWLAASCAAFVCTAAGIRIATARHEPPALVR
jgi:sulfoxide reductase heme-binding subunit YedZ